MESLCDIATAIFEANTCRWMRYAIFDTGYGGFLVANIDDTRIAQTGTECGRHMILQFTHRKH